MNREEIALLLGTGKPLDFLRLKGEFASVFVFVGGDGEYLLNVIGNNPDRVASAFRLLDGNDILGPWVERDSSGNLKKFMATFQSLDVVSSVTAALARHFEIRSVPTLVSGPLKIVGPEYDPE